ncbi:unnamed protein product [Vitrella brassicaformis CCMP3155]|uniref:TLDc domain-containing protein n=1 Tax=Vitrella brassicaformis (strain CCMP3155) TaxID=1169540 RepID=A0A0G4EY74_VITBC|nr:unnamed protein product [Vitrella brassicaformis CCMP3155]|eukprot:CEM03385.1 unnamed protein product [Vitrella brassicaformis CCMP3155]
MFIVDGAYIQDSFKERRGSAMSADTFLSMLEYVANTLGVENVQTHFVDGDPDKWYSTVARGRHSDSKEKRITLHNELRHQQRIKSRVTVALCDFKKQNVGYSERGEKLQGWVQGGDVMIVRRMLKTAYENSRLGARGSAASSSADGCSDGITTIVLFAGDKDFSDTIDDCLQLGLRVAIVGYKDNMAGELKEKPSEIRIIYLDEWPADHTAHYRERPTTMQRRSSSHSTRLRSHSSRPTPQSSADHGSPFVNDPQAPPAGGRGSSSSVSAAAAAVVGGQDELDRLFTEWLGCNTKLRLLYRASRDGTKYDDLLRCVGDEWDLVFVICKDEYVFGVFISDGLQEPDDPTARRKYECDVWWFSLAGHFAQPTKIDIHRGYQCVYVAGRDGSVGRGAKVEVGGYLELGHGHSSGWPAADIRSCCQKIYSKWLPRFCTGGSFPSPYFMADEIEILQVVTQ